MGQHIGAGFWSSPVLKHLHQHIKDSTEGHEKLIS
uniref:Uncharacterized protein n=1 Tax=Anguilla anguilla TaxID=7936 RepID=A0A0E9VLW1_ANGAN